LFLSGIDLVNGTPILDIKPYIPNYDCISSAIAPPWIQEAPRPMLEKISFSNEAQQQLKTFLPQLIFYKTFEEICKAIEEVLLQDPRSIHLKESWSDQPYGFCIDCLNVICKFFPDRTALVIGIEDWSAHFNKSYLPKTKIKKSSENGKTQSKKQKKEQNISLNSDTLQDTISPTETT